MNAFTLQAGVPTERQWEKKKTPLEKRQ